MEPRIETNKKHFFHRIISTSTIKQHPALPILAFACTLALSASLTSLNQGLAREHISHQSIFIAFFCIEAAVIYALYMIVSRYVKCYFEPYQIIADSEKQDAFFFSVLYRILLLCRHGAC